MRRNPLFPTTEGEVINMEEVAAGTPLTESPEVGDRFIYPDAKSWRQKDSSGNDTVIVNSKTDVVDPAVTDDSTKGFIEGSLWTNSSTDKAFILVDPSAGAAIWLKLKSATIGSTSASEPLHLKTDPTNSASEAIRGEITGFVMQNGDPLAVVSNLQIPKATDLSVDPTLDFQFLIHVTGSGNADVRLRLESSYIADGEDATPASPSETLFFTKAVINVLDQQHSVSFTLDKTLIAQDDRVAVRLTRLGDDPLDTFTGDIMVYELARLNFGN